MAYYVQTTDRSLYKLNFISFVKAYNRDIDYHEVVNTNKMKFIR